MNVNGKHYQSVWFDEGTGKLFYINQNSLKNL
jgi:hypothetical protein